MADDLFDRLREGSPEDLKWYPRSADGAIGSRPVVGYRVRLLRGSDRTADTILLSLRFADTEGLVVSIRSSLAKALRNQIDWMLDDPESETSP